MLFDEFVRELLVQDDRFPDTVFVARQDQGPDEWMNFREDAELNEMPPGTFHSSTALGELSLEPGELPPVSGEQIVCRTFDDVATLICKAKAKAIALVRLLPPDKEERLYLITDYGSGFPQVNVLIGAGAGGYTAGSDYRYLYEDIIEWVGGRPRVQGYAPHRIRNVPAALRHFGETWPQ